MRFSALLALALSAHVASQTTTQPEPEPTMSIQPAPEPTEPPTSDSFTPTPTIPQPSETETTETEPTTTIPPSATALPPVGGGASCVQACLAQAAFEVGCASIADFRCVCKSERYFVIAQGCFSGASCQDSAVQTAAGEYESSCRRVDGATSSQTQPSSRVTTSRTRTNTDTLTSLTTQTLVFTSGAVVTLSDGVATTLASGFTTTRTGQMGDLAGGAPTATSPPNNGAIGNLDWNPWGRMGMIAGLGAVGGMIVLAV